MERATGISFKPVENPASKDSTSRNTLSGAIKGITEVQADLLSDQFNGLQLTGMQQLNVAMQSYEAHLKIEVNTRLTAQRLDGLIPALNKIIDNQGKNAGIAAGNGRVGG